MFYNNFITLFCSLKPRNIARFVIQNAPFINTERKVEWDAFDRPHFAFGIFRAAAEAKALNLDRISVVEFGVAGGNGLISMEKIADEISTFLNIKIDIYGFDTGEGMPAPKDYRDLPHIWQEGFYKMDVPQLEKKLKKAKLVLGDVEQTVRTFNTKFNAPIGFVAFDLDFYSSTISAFELFRRGHQLFLPRVFCYFDDIVGGDWDNHCEDIGVLRAIREFNQMEDMRKIRPIHALNLKRRFAAVWNVKSYIYHRLDHPFYNKYLTPNIVKQISLK